MEVFNSRNGFRNTLGTMNTRCSLYTGKVLDVAYESQDDGGMIIVSDWHGGNNQRWKFEVIGYNTYAINQ